MVEFGFNPQEYEVPVAGEPVKPGWYACRINKVELKPTKNGSGSYLEFTFTVDENHHPDNAGRLVWDRLNIFNQNEKTQKWGRGLLRKIQECVGRPTSTNTDELLGLPLLVKVKIRAATAEYEATNEVDDYKPLAEGGVPQQSPPQTAGASAGTAPPQQPQTTTTSAPAGAVANGAAGNVPAWARR